MSGHAKYTERDIIIFASPHEALHGPKGHVMHGRRECHITRPHEALHGSMTCQGNPWRPGNGAPTPRSRTSSGRVSPAVTDAQHWNPSDLITRHGPMLETGALFNVAWTGKFTVSGRGWHAPEFKKGC